MINYYLLTKPGIVLGNLLTMAAGFLLASKGVWYFGLFFATFMGLAFVMASACILNNYIDRQRDSKMERTKNRALARGTISGRSAILFAALLGGVGGLILLAYTNLLALSVAAVGYFVYVVLYSVWKGRTIYGTAIGSIAGAVPPAVGYCAVSNQLDGGVLILFAMLVLWQMPHFFSIAMTHFNDYVAAEIPVLPVIKGIWRTKIHMLLYILAFTFSAMLLTLFGYTGNFYLAVALVLGLTWFGLCLAGFAYQNDQLWARSMFRLSLVLITAICFAISLDIV
ncbi:MAG: heme o synthase [Parachlamydia sp.]|nr:heme o synthase [Parachlamydia sp.]